MAEGKVSRPDVSVIVPFFNSAAYLETCIGALQAAAREARAEAREVELLLVDNGSSDESAALARRHDGVTVLSEEQPGAYAARNAGLRAARGGVIAFTDADCAVAPDWLSVICRRMADPTLGLLIGEVHFPASAGPALRLVAGWENAKADYVTRYGAPGNRIAYCNNLAVRASLFESLGPFRAWQRAGDSEFAQRVARERPDLDFEFEPSMRVTHHEFLRARDRLRRMRLYTQTNAQIEGFEELSLVQRLAIARHWLFG